MMATWPLEMLSIFLFEDMGDGKTKFTVKWSPHNSSDVERATFAEGHASMNQGWSGTFEQLAGYLASARNKQ